MLPQLLTMLPAQTPRSSEASGAPGEPDRPRRRDFRTAVLLGLACLLVYNANLRTIGSGDTLPARYIPFGLWRYHTVILNPIRDTVRETYVRPYWIVGGIRGHLISLYPVVLPVLVAPLYLPAVLHLDHRGWNPHVLLRTAIVMEKLTASLIAAAASALFYLLVRRRAPPRDALLLAVAFAFGTSTWMIGGQALWQHGIAELMLVGILLLLTGGATAPRALALGALCGLVAGNRPPDALLVAGLGLCGLLWAERRRRAVWVVAGAAVTGGLVALYNVTQAGTFIGAYTTSYQDDFIRNGLAGGLAGLLASPARGLLVFSPFLLLVPAGFLRGLRDGDRETRAIHLALGTGFVALLLFYSRMDWRGGSCYGPRWLVDALPLLVWLLPPALAVLGRGGRVLWVAAVALGIAVQVVGAFWYTGASDQAIYSAPIGPGGMDPTWDPRNAPFLAELRHPPAGADPAFLGRWEEQHGMVGSLDRVTVSGRKVTTAGAGAPLVVEGWALAQGRTPIAVEVSLDGEPRAVTADFFKRPDVTAGSGTGEKQGFRVVVPLVGVAPGDHVLSVEAWRKDVAMPEFVDRRQLTVVGAAGAGGTGAGDADLAAAARDAAALLRAHQQEAGYWFTYYTWAPRLNRPQVEMNTYLTAMMVDMLAPVAARADLAASLARARAHLAGQIEADGLVRYHGRPDGPTIPSLGCVITPDADDTALAWRLAGEEPAAGDPAGRAQRLAQALGVLAKYRTREGLYRTWLAPRRSYQCLDPGFDPDPADVGIQMHVYLFLAQAEPAAARELCTDLRTQIASRRVWVYYQKAPLVPILRQADLAREGCALDLPAARLTPVASQEEWVAAGRLLARELGGDAGGGAPAAAEARTLLLSLAKDGFASVRRNPPLLYHNDLTALTRRDYWSEDFGYALWLRLYFALEGAGGGRTDGDRPARP